MKVYGYLTTEYPLASDVLGKFIERDANIVFVEGKVSKVRVKVRPTNLYSKSQDDKVYVYEIDSIQIEGLEKAIEDILTIIPATLIRIYWPNSTLLLFAISDKTSALKF